MNPLARRRYQRRVRARAAVGAATALNLAQARPGSEHAVVRVNDPKLRLQLLRLGIAEGGRIRCEYHLPRGPTVIAVGRTVLAIGRRSAELIELA